MIRRRCGSRCYDISRTSCRQTMNDEVGSLRNSRHHMSHMYASSHTSTFRTVTCMCLTALREHCMPPTQKMAVCYIETVAEREGRFPAGLASPCSSLWHFVAPLYRIRRLSMAKVPGILREDGSDEPSEHMCFASGNIRARWHGMQQAPDVVSRPELEQECARYM